MDKLKVVSINFKRADVKIRGLFAFTVTEKSGLYLQLREYLGIREAMILTTCNRTEVYYVDERDLGAEIVSLMASMKGLKGSGYLPWFELESRKHAALRHLFRVGIGLESQILGDIQIFGQMKQAYQEATDADMAGTMLHRAMHSLFYTHKQVCQETAFKSGAASATFNTVKILLREFSNRKDLKILVAGAGKMGTGICKNLVEAGFTHITIANRTYSRAKDLGELLSLSVLDFSKINDQLHRFEVIISAAGCEQPIFTASEKAAAESGRLVILDLCAPSSFSDEFIRSHASQHHTIDSIGSLQEETLGLRSAEVPKVEAIISRSIGELSLWVAEYGYTREIKKFKETLEQLRRECIARYLKETDGAGHELVERITGSMIQKIVAIPAVQLKQACQRNNAEILGETLNRLFNPGYQDKSKLKAN